MTRKLIFLAAFILVAGVSGYSQDTRAKKAAEDAAKAFSDAPEIVEKGNFWSKKATVDVGFYNTLLTNWAAGGYNNLTVNTGLDAEANYKKAMMSWDNRLQLKYNFLISEDKPGVIQKTNDRIYFESKWAYRTSEQSKWNYTASTDFRSQFSDSYKFGNPIVEDPKKAEDYSRTLQSGMLAPGYLNVALGMEWKPNNWFNINFAPLTGGLTFCRIPELRKTYGMKLIDGTEDQYHDILFQFGAQIKTNFKFIFNEVFTYETQLVLFSDYLNQPKNLRVNWDNSIKWQLNKLFKIGFDTWLIYDPLVKIADETHPDGVQKIQLKEYLSLNLTYTFTPKKK